MSARRRRQHLKAINPDAWDPQEHNLRRGIQKMRRQHAGDPLLGTLLVAKYGHEWLQRYWR